MMKLVKCYIVQKSKHAKELLKLIKFICNKLKNFSYNCKSSLINENEDDDAGKSRQYKRVIIVHLPFSILVRM
jgi:hypothetical protein